MINPHIYHLLWIKVLIVCDLLLLSIHILFNVKKAIVKAYLRWNEFVLKKFILDQYDNIWFLLCALFEPQCVWEFEVVTNSVSQQKFAIFEVFQFSPHLISSPHLTSWDWGLWCQRWESDFNEWWVMTDFCFDYSDECSFDLSTFQFDCFARIIDLRFSFHHVSI